MPWSERGSETSEMWAGCCLTESQPGVFGRRTRDLVAQVRHYLIAGGVEGQWGRGNVYSSTTFSVGGLASRDVIDAVSAAQAAKPEVATNQVAARAVTDNPSLDELRDRFEADDRAIADAWAILSNAGLDPGSRKMFARCTAAL